MLITRHIQRYTDGHGNTIIVSECNHTRDKEAAERGNPGGPAGYRTRAYFVGYIRTCHDAEFLPTLHASGQNRGPNADTLIQQSTGKPPAAVGSEMQSAATA
jgi:hypothetical protein